MDEEDLLQEERLRVLDAKLERWGQLCSFVVFVHVFLFLEASEPFLYAKWYQSKK
jgi:hypothetical protein